jgi:hypothetical protein
VYQLFTAIQIFEGKSAKELVAQGLKAGNLSVESSCILWIAVFQKFLKLLLGKAWYAKLTLNFISKDIHGFLAQAVCFSARSF